MCLEVESLLLLVMGSWELLEAPLWGLKIKLRLGGQRRQMISDGIICPKPAWSQHFSWSVWWGDPHIHYLSQFALGVHSLKTGNKFWLIEDGRSQQHFHGRNALAAPQGKALKSRSETKIHEVPGAWRSFHRSSHLILLWSSEGRTGLPGFKAAEDGVQGWEGGIPQTSLSDSASVQGDLTEEMACGSRSEIYKACVPHLWLIIPHAILIFVPTQPIDFSLEHISVYLLPYYYGSL